MIYAVIKDKKVVSFLFNQEQIEFLQSQDTSLSFLPIDVSWDSQNPILLTQCSVQDDGTVSISN